MPLLCIDTSQPLPADTGPLLAAASRLVAQELGKPERYVMVRLEHKPHMCFAGSTAPSAFLQLKSIGLPASATSALSAALCAFIQGTLGVDPQRIYIEFSDAPRAYWGWNGGTF